MTFAELIQKHKWEDVSKRLLELYPDQSEAIEGYEYVFLLIPAMEPEENDGMRLCIRHSDDSDICEGNDELETEEWEDVHGKNSEPLKNFDGELILDDDGNTIEQTWAIELSSWNYWASMPIDEQTLKDYAEIDIICHALWEMTFFGFDQDKIREQKEELESISKSIDDGTAKLIPWEEVKKTLEEGLGEEI